MPIFLVTGNGNCFYLSESIVLIVYFLVDQGFVYRDLEDDNTQLGMRVVAPFGKRRLTGFVVNVFDNPPEGLKLRTISRRVDSQSLFEVDFFSLANWLSKTYFSSVLLANLEDGNLHD